MPIEATETFRVLRMDEPMYGCEAPPEDAPLLCEVLLEGLGGRRVITCPDALLTRRGIQEGDAVQLLADGTLQKLP